MCVSKFHILFIHRGDLAIRRKLDRAAYDQPSFVFARYAMVLLNVHTAF